jgi:hypothetical protein
MGKTFRLKTFRPLGKKTCQPISPKPTPRLGFMDSLLRAYSLNG